MLCGILNGIDASEWDPAADPAIERRYDGAHLEAKKQNRRALRAELGLAQSTEPLAIVVGRLTWQKGVDLVLEAAQPRLLERMQLAILGTGEASLERAARDLAERHGGRVATTIGFDEKLAHRMVAGADAIIVPSRFEPCGLTQLYGLRYGTVPIVRRVGGLADSVLDSANVDEATGFAFDAASASALSATLERAIERFAAPSRWQKMMRNGMRQNLDWAVSAREYEGLYRDCLSNGAGG